MFRRKKGEFVDFFNFVIIAFIIFPIIHGIVKKPPVIVKSELSIPAPIGYVNDFAGVISPVNKNNLNSYLNELDKRTGAQVAVVTLSSLKGNAIEDVSLDIGRKWGIGQKGKDNGVVILVATGDKKMRIEVGYGLEGVITDGLAGRIRDGYMLPFFKHGDIEKGIINGTYAVISVIAKSYQVKMPLEFDSSVSSYGKNQNEPGQENFVFIVIFLVIISTILSIRYGSLVNYNTNYGRGFGGSSSGSSGGFSGGSFGGGGASGSW